MNELVFQTFLVIMDFVDASKKENKSSAKENEKIWVKMFSSFWTTRVLKELVIIVGNEPILINTFFHYGIIWKKMWCPKGHDFEKSNKSFDHACSGNWPWNSWFRNLFLEFFGNQATKMMNFWKKLTIGNLVCIKTCYSFKPVKTLSMTKNASPKIVIFRNHL